MHYDNTWHSRMPFQLLMDCSPLVDGHEEDEHYDDTWHSQMPLLFLLDCSPLVNGDEEEDAL